MTLQISTHKLLKQELRQNGWMLGLTGLGHFLSGPVVFLLDTSNHSNWTDAAAQRRYLNYFTDIFFIWQLLTMIACICIGIFIYRYLFSKRMMDLYHSVPISRSQLFWVKYLHGFLIWFLPFMVSSLSIFLLILFQSFGAPYLLTVMVAQIKSMALVLLCFFIFYHLFLTAVYLSGNTVNMFANTGMIGLSVIGLWAACQACADSFFDTFAYQPTDLVYDMVYSASPFAAPFAIYAYLISNELFTRHLPLILLSVLVTFGLLALSRALSLQRPSELAERGTIAKSYAVPSRILISVLAGIAGSLFFSAIAGSRQQLAWGIFGALLGSIVCFGAINSVFHATIKSFFRYRIQIVLTAAASTLIIVAFQLDLFGYDTFLPAKENIAGVAIYSNQFSDDSGYISIKEYNSSDLFSSQKNYHVKQEHILTDPDLSYALLDAFVHSDTGTGYSTYYTRVTLKNGRSYERRYRLPYSKYTALAPFIELDAYRDTNYKFSTGILGYPAELNIDLWDINLKVKGEELERIMDAYWADFKDHYTLDELSSYLRVFTLSGHYVIAGTANNHYFSLAVHDNYTRTLSLLQELYPEYETAVTTPEAIKEISLQADIYGDAKKGLTSIDGIYEYFGYVRASTDTVEGASANSNAINNTPESPGQTIYNPGAMVELAEATVVPQELLTYSQIIITDSEMIEELYPLLYFGHYRDLYDRGEYIYVGQITTTKNTNVNCYVKPGTLPEKYMQMLYDARKDPMEY